MKIIFNPLTGKFDYVVNKLTELSTRNHNDTLNRDAADAHPESAITWLVSDLSAKVDKSGSVTQIATRNHNDLQNRDAVGSHPWSSINQRHKSPLTMQRLAAYTWTGRSASEASDWISVVWSPELGLFVAVANTGTNQVMTSPDGINWTSRPALAAEGSPWYSVTWSPELGLFVAVGIVGGTNQVMTSPDGINWTSRSASEASDWYSVTWSPELGLFVAVAGFGTNLVMTSPNGIDWTSHCPAALLPADWYSVVWSPELGLFVAVAYSGTTRVMTSPNGFDWTGRLASEASEWVSVTWSPELSLFVAVADIGTNMVMTSPNGIDWTSRSASEASTWWSVVWSPELGLFVAVATAGTNLVMMSPNGIDWTSRSASEATYWFSVTWSPELGLFVAVSYAGGTNQVMTSESISDYDRLGEELLKVVDHTKTVHDALGIDADTLDSLHGTGYTKTTAGGTINVSTAAELTAALAALAAAPSLLGNIIIQLATGTYASAITIPSLMGREFSLTLQGGTTTNLSTTATDGTAGNQTTQATVIRAAAGWTVNAYRGQWLKFTSGALNNQIYVVDDNTATQINLCGNYLSSAPQNGDSFIIYSNNASITGNITVSPTTCVLKFSNFNIKNFLADGLLNCVFTEVYQYQSTDAQYSYNKISVSFMIYIRCYFQMENLYNHIWLFGSIAIVHSCLAYCSDVNYYCWHTKAQAGAHVLYESGNIIDGFYQGHDADIGGSSNFWTGDSVGDINQNETNTHLKNCTTGIRAENGGLVNGVQATDGNTGAELCTTFKNPAAAGDPAYIK